MQNLRQKSFIAPFPALIFWDEKLESFLNGKWQRQRRKIIAFHCTRAAYETTLICRRIHTTHIRSLSLTVSLLLYLSHIPSVAVWWCAVVDVDDGYVTLRQCDQIGRFLKILWDSFSHKSSPIFGKLLGCFKKHRLLSNNRRGYFLNNLLNKIRLLFIPISGHTAWKLVRVSECAFEWEKLWNESRERVREWAPSYVPT